VLVAVRDRSKNRQRMIFSAPPPLVWLIFADDPPVARRDPLQHLLALRAAAPALADVAAVVKEDRELRPPGFVPAVDHELADEQI
jgi:hypothetical protein